MENTVTVSRNDAAFLEVAKQYFTLRAELHEVEEAWGLNPATDIEFLKSKFRDPEIIDLEMFRTAEIAQAYLRGEEVILAKLAQV